MAEKNKLEKRVYIEQDSKIYRLWNSYDNNLTSLEELFTWFKKSIQLNINFFFFFKILKLFFKVVILGSNSFGP